MNALVCLTCAVLLALVVYGQGWDVWLKLRLIFWGFRLTGWVIDLLWEVMQRLAKIHFILCEQYQRIREEVLRG